MSFLRTFLRLFAVLCMIFGAMPASARMGLIVGEPFGSFGTIMPQGHASIYLADACVETAVRLRPCRPGEPGSVISRYHDLKHPEMDWMAFPLPVFLYGISDPAALPKYMTPTLEAELRERYRQEHLANLVPELANKHGDLRTPPYGDWEEGIGAAYDRRLFLYTFDTTLAQDAAMLAWLNERPNRRSYTLTRANCADFAADLLRLALPPKLLKRNVLADFDMTTPKTLAREVDGYGRAHPDLHLEVQEVPQLPGSLRRSRPIRGAAESLISQKRYFAVVVVVQPELMLADLIVYEKLGRWKLGADAVPAEPAMWIGADREIVHEADDLGLAP